MVEEGPRSLRPSSTEARAFVDQARSVILQLAVLIRNSHLHEPDNEVFDEPMDRLRSVLEIVLHQEGKLDLECTGSELFANRMRLRPEIRNLQIYRYVASEISSRGLGGLRFITPPDRRALASFLAVLLRHDGVGGSVAAFNRALDEAGVIEIDALERRQEEIEPAADRRQRAIETYQQALDFIRECMTGKESPAEVNLRRAKRTIHKMVDLSYEEGDGFSLAGLAAVKSHNEYTFNHMVNVCVLAISFGQRLGLARSRLAELGLCALYHDMGKLQIPLEVLEKHGKLSEEEWALMGNHTVFGARSLYPLISGDRSSVDRVLAALMHHGGFDGGGYPKLQVLDRQPLFVRMVAIVDAFDAMTTKRVYQKQFLPDEALAIMQQEAGTRYDPLLLKAFINCLGVYPVGSLVMLASGELAVVCQSNADLEMIHLPTVKVVTDAAQQRRDPELVNLADPDQGERQIVRCVDPEHFDINCAHYAI